MENKIREMLLESAEVKKTVANTMAGKVEKFAAMTLDTMKSGKKVLVCGNGGSAADAQHFAAEFIVRYKTDRKTLPAIALTTDTSVITAHANDYGFNTLFERQVEALGNKGDLFVGISTSGNSENVMLALKMAKEKGMKTVALLGKDGGKTKGMADLDIIIPSSQTARIQEAQMCIRHIVCELVENEFVAKAWKGGKEQ